MARVRAANMCKVGGSAKLSWFTSAAGGVSMLVKIKPTVPYVAISEVVAGQQRRAALLVQCYVHGAGGDWASCLLAVVLFWGGLEQDGW
jgi:hypothetical protein